jgi:hypothetical protein
LPKKDKINIQGNVRAMEKKDTKEVLRLYNIMTEKCPIHQIMTE